MGIFVECWSGNGSFWSSLGMLYDALGSFDLLCLIETHKSFVRPLPDIPCYHWFSAYWIEMRSFDGV